MEADAKKNSQEPEKDLDLPTTFDNPYAGVRHGDTVALQTPDGIRVYTALVTDTVSHHPLGWRVRDTVDGEPYYLQIEPGYCLYYTGTEYTGGEFIKLDYRQGPREYR